MSMHFAPQWVKPIKPSGTSTTPTTDTPPTLSNTTSATAFPTSHSSKPSLVTSHQPFPALTASTNSVPPPNPALSYSRATHTPTSANFPTDSSYFPLTDAHMNGHGEVNPHPFRYSREQMLALWDEEKVREVPIELVDFKQAGVLVSERANRPVGLRELSEQEKKLLATSVHPSIPARRAIPATNGTEANIAPGRRGVGAAGPGKEPNGQVNGRPGGFGGFGRGEGGAFGSIGGGKGVIGGGITSPGGVGEGRMPGSLGGGFGGVGKRVGRVRTESSDTGPDGNRSATAPTWRPTRTMSGSFEGVLGFGSAVAPSAGVNAPAPPIEHPENPSTPNTSGFDNSEPNAGGPWGEKEQARDKEAEGPAFGQGGGPGWGSGQKKWRVAAGLSGQNEGDKSINLHIPISFSETRSESVAATASGTPLPERDASVLGPIAMPARPQEQAPAPPAPAEKEDLGAVQWYYRDPGGQEQGPFTGSQMHDWYSHSYFDDTLPLRRSAETTFHSLAELKIATGNAVQPFLSPLRPRNLPPNLPIPRTALQAISSPLQSTEPSLANSFQQLGMHDPALQPPQQPFEQHQLLSPSQYPAQQAYPSPAASFIASPAQAWGNIGQPQRVANGAYGSVGLPSPIGQAPAYAHQQPAPQQQPFYAPRREGQDFFSPSVGVGAVPPSPWGGMPAPVQPAPYQQVQQHISPLPAWQPPVTASVPAQERQQVPVADEPSYFPPTAPTQDDPASSEPALQSEPAPSESFDEIEPEKADGGSTGSEPTVETPVQAVTPPVAAAETVPSSTAPKAPQSVWGQTPAAVKLPSAPSSRKPSLAVPASAAPSQVTPVSPSTSTTLPPAPASLPAKPVASTVDKPVQPAAPPAESIKSPVAALPPKPAPWDKLSRTPSQGPSLREIQEAESKQADARKKAAQAEARAVASPAISTSDEVPSNLTWGLPSSQQKSSAAASPATPSAATVPSAPVWGGGEQGPKKTLKQIQEEEEKRKQKAALLKAQQLAAAQGGQPPAGAATTPGKRGYADLAANAPGWTTVGATGKTTVPASSPATPVAARPKPATPVTSSILPPKPTATPTPTPSAQQASKPAKLDETPTADFIRWAKLALTGLQVPVDDFLAMLLTFPVDPPASSRSEVLEIISDSVYANSKTLDGRRFAQEFFAKRKADAQAKAGGSGASKLLNSVGAGGAVGGGGVSGGGVFAMSGSSLADVVKTVPQKKDDAGFKIVKAKGKKKN